MIAYNLFDVSYSNIGINVYMFIQHNFRNLPVSYPNQTMLQIEENVSLKNFNTFGIEASAKYFIEINSEEELAELFMDPQWHQTERLVIGGGSNLLLVKDFEGLVIRMNIRGIVHRINHEEVLVEAGAGENWNELVNYCVDHGFAGMENLTLIPGSVGASPIQNIGAYGVELKDVFESCRPLRSGRGM
jgi:UDP-N-acetylmuramate dehydrogenase